MSFTYTLTIALMVIKDLPIALLSTSSTVATLNLRVSASHNPPALVIEKTPNGTFTYKGVVYEMVEYLAASLKVTYVFVNENKTEVEQLGEIQANMNLALRKEVDIVSIGFSPSPERIVVLDFSAPLIMQPNRLVVPFPKESNRLLGPILPFQPTVWLWLGLTMIVVILMLTLLSIAYNIQAKRRRPLGFDYIYRLLGKYFGYVMTIITNQGNWLPNKQLPFTLLLGAWCLMACVLVNAYSSILVSYLSVPKLHPIVNSLEELAGQKELRLIVPGKTILANRILESTSGPYKALGDSLRMHPEDLAKKYSYIPEAMTKMDHAYPAIDLLTHMLIFMDLKRYGVCRFTLSKPLAIFVPYSFAYPKNSPLTSSINKKLLEMLASGLVTHWLEKDMARIDQCRLEKQPKRVQQKSLRLSDVISAFAILGLGIMLVLIVFILENIYSKLTKPKTRARGRHFYRNRDN